MITLPDDVAARLEGKSSLGRLGLLTHSTAGFIDPGFSGHVTLELSNVATLPIKLWPGMKIGQLCFFRLSSPSENPYGSAKYGSRYQGQRGPTPSRSFQNFHRTTSDLPSARPLGSATSPRRPRRLRAASAVCLSRYGPGGCRQICRASEQSALRDPRGRWRDGCAHAFEEPGRLPGPRREREPSR